MPTPLRLLLTTLLAALLPLPALADGAYRAALQIENAEIPFIFTVTDPPSDRSESAAQARILNSPEVIPVQARWLRSEAAQPRLILDFPHYDSRIEMTLDADGALSGEWTKTQRGGAQASIPIKAAPALHFGGHSRFHPETDSTGIHGGGLLDHGIDGRWRIEFAESGPAIGTFKAAGSWYLNLDSGESIWGLTGAIDTPTGDYRFLDGVLRLNSDSPDTIALSVFDGAHAFLIEATIDESLQRMSGTFYSGAHWRESFTAERIKSDEYTLPDPFSEVAIKPGQTKFRLPALENAKYAHKPVIVQIFGTWCPNCHDEAPVLLDLYNRHHAQGLEIISLAYEHTGDDARSRAQIERFREKYDIPWEILIAGVSDKTQAAATLPDLTAVKAFPTTIFINRDGTVRAIHSGFAGPATGEKHEDLKREFNRLTHEMVEEHREGKSREN